MKHSYRHIVITGASSGIGEALALYFARNVQDGGVVLSLTGRDARRLESVAQACRTLGAKVEAEVLCVTDRAAMDEWLKARDEAAAVDLVVANAGVSGGTAGGQAEGRAQIDHIMAVNVDGVLNSVHPLLERMQARGSGQVAIMASLAGMRGWPGAPAYCASKATVRVYGEGLRGVLAGTGVRVNVICPGFVQSRMTDVNDFAMPFKIGAARAAKIIVRGLVKDKSRISFPWQASMIMWFVVALPTILTDMFLRKMPSKREIL